MARAGPPMAWQALVLPVNGGFKVVVLLLPCAPPVSRPSAPAACRRRTSSALTQWPCCFAGLMQAVYRFNGQEYTVEPLQSAEAAALLIDAMTGEGSIRVACSYHWHPPSPVCPLGAGWQAHCA